MTKRGQRAVATETANKRAKTDDTTKEHVINGDMVLKTYKGLALDVGAQVELIGVFSEGGYDSFRDNFLLKGERDNTPVIDCGTTASGYMALNMQLCVGDVRTTLARTTTKSFVEGAIRSGVRTFVLDESSTYFQGFSREFALYLADDVRHGYEDVEYATAKNEGRAVFQRGRKTVALAFLMRLCMMNQARRMNPSATRAYVILDPTWTDKEDGAKSLGMMMAQCDRLVRFSPSGSEAYEVGHKLGQASRMADVYVGMVNTIFTKLAAQANHDCRSYIKGLHLPVDVNDKKKRFIRANEVPPLELEAAVVEGKQ